MKKFFFCAAAAIVALASCSKTQVVYNDAPEEIGFKAVSGVMTKAPLTRTELPTTATMMVYASKSAEETGKYTPYFSKQTFEWKANTYWGGTTAQYWPESGYLKFIAYCPSTIGTDVTGDATQNIVISDVDAADQTDILYTNLTAAQECANKPVVAMPFLHALAQVQVTAKVSNADMTDVNVTKVVLKTPILTGNLTLTGTDATWADQANGEDITMNNVIASTDLTTTSQTLGTGTLVVPGATTSTLVVTYTIGGLEVTTDPISIAGTWEKGKKYIYNLTIGLDEIILNPSVSDWTDADSVQNNPAII